MEDCYESIKGDIAAEESTAEVLRDSPMLILLGEDGICWYVGYGWNEKR